MTSSKPFSEPMVKFLVQVMWPNGRLLRDYSVLLDPSKFSPQAADCRRATLRRQCANHHRADHCALDASAAPSTPPRHAIRFGKLRRRRATAVSVQQTMLAIQALNPDAFIGGNINRLKTGQVLRLPDSVQKHCAAAVQAHR